MKRALAGATWAGISALALTIGCTPGAAPQPEPNPPSSTAPVTTTTAAATAAPTTSATAKDTAQSTPTPGGAHEAAVKASNAFGLDLYRQVAAKPGNLAISPASLSIALAMTYAGAKGATADEMARVMHLPTADALHGGWATLLARWGNDVEHVELRVANRLFGDKSFSFEKSFLALTAERYAAPIEARDFMNAPEVQRTYINGWVANQTKERITNLIPPPGIDSDTRLVLANALYLRAPWVEAFSERRTEDGSFYENGTKEVKVPMMSRTATLRFAETTEVQLVELDYKGRELGMLIALPKQRNGLAAVESKLDEAAVGGWVGQLKAERVWLSLPRFKVDPAATLSLKEPLQAMGLKLAFQRGAADFTGIADPSTPADRLSIGNVFHKAFVAVDEKGTEAAAATAVVMTRAGAAAPAEPTRVEVDHPFLFFIRDLKTQTLLFVGRVVAPSGR